jgi:hypothetical protein
MYAVGDRESRARDSMAARNGRCSKGIRTVNRWMLLSFFIRRRPRRRQQQNEVLQMVLFFGLDWFARTTTDSMQVGGK